jgi:DNA-binding beta-propeller fold protein YncE
VAGLALLALVLAGPAGASTGHFERAWGKGVVEGGAGFGICTSATACDEGQSGGLGGELDFAQGLAAERSGITYVADTVNNRIQKFDPAGNFLLAWGKDVVVGGGTGFEVCAVASACQPGAAGALAGEFEYPRGIAVDASGDVYVNDSNNNRIQKFTSSGGFLRMWGKDVVDGGGSGFEVCTTPALCQAGAIGSDGGELTFPQGGLAVDAAGIVYVVDAYGGLDNQRIQAYDPSGNFIRAWGKDVVDGGGSGFEVCTAAASCKAGASGGLGGELSGARGVATDAAGNVYVGDTANQRVQKFDPSGAFLSAWGADVTSGGGVDFEICTAATSCKTGSTGTLGGAFNFPEGVAVDPGGNVYVADSLNMRIQRFDPSGGFSRAWGVDVDSRGAIRFLEICLVASRCKQGIFSIAGDGGELRATAIAADAAGNVFAVGPLDDRVQKFYEGLSVRLVRRKLRIGVPAAGSVKVRDAKKKKRKRSIKSASRTANSPGTLPIKLKLTERGKEKLTEDGRVKLEAALTYQRAGGFANTQVESLKIKRR